MCQCCELQVRICRPVDDKVIAGSALCTGSPRRADWWHEPTGGSRGSEEVRKVREVSGLGHVRSLLLVTARVRLTTARAAARAPFIANHPVHSSAPEQCAVCTRRLAPSGPLTGRADGSLGADCHQLSAASSRQLWTGGNSDSDRRGGQELRHPAVPGGAGGPEIHWRLSTTLWFGGYRRSTSRDLQSPDVA